MRIEQLHMYTYAMCLCVSVQACHVSALPFFKSDTVRLDSESWAERVREGKSEGLRVLTRWLARCHFVFVFFSSQEGFSKLIC